MKNKEDLKVVNFYWEGSSAPIFFSDEKHLKDWENSKNKSKFFLTKDNFWTKDFPTTASSLFLSSFFPVDDATVIKLLKEKDYKLLGKTTLDEFACGGTGLFSSEGEITNPHNSKNLSGGSSSGSAFAVASKIVPFTLGHDTGDSVRRPASYCGVIGFKPSYGLISRYGIIPMASSFDTVGILSLDLSIIEKVFKIIAKSDYRDLVTLSAEKKKKRFSIKSNLRKIAIIRGIENFLSEEYSQVYLSTIEFLRNSGKYEIIEIEIPDRIRDNLQITYLILCSSELVSHLGSLQGITYGHNDSNESIENKRTQFIGKWVKERILIGNYFLKDNEFLSKAKQFRYIIKKWSEEIFSMHQFLIFPGTNGSAPTIDSFLNNDNMNASHWSDNLLLIANFTGSPSINIPIGKENGMPISLNIDSYWKNDKAVIDLANFILNKS
ncbi:MAG: Glutamyl-tRNA(Gln) amidotransferase subunit A [Mycoplasmataceae bacterium]|nr:MAG: Glutamyl-tRNA(Gln) amidotransferase subunit A [Mycoplasmataceae bacterium]